MLGPLDVNMSNGSKPLAIGVFGGSFNPIHSGHALLAITTQTTKPVDRVVLVPVFKHHVKTDLLPFEDRVAMCELAVAPFRGKSGSGVEVSTIEREVGESNAAMLRALKMSYPEGTKLFWICGDDVFDWIESPKGLETMREITGLIVQRRLHKAHSDDGADRFFKAPLDEAKIRAIGVKIDLNIDFIYGELPHFSSTLVRRAQGQWRPFLPSTVAAYLDARPSLLSQLHANLEADAKSDLDMDQPSSKPQRSRSELDSRGLAAACVMLGLDAVHALQRERGQTGVRLSLGVIEKLREMQALTDALIREVLETLTDENRFCGYDEALALAAELKKMPAWLAQDRAVVEKRSAALANIGGEDQWLGRSALLDKFNCRIEVLMGMSMRALNEITESAGTRAVDEDGAMQLSSLPNLLLRWSEGKEALGRLRSLVCAGGPTAPSVVRNSLVMRQRLSDTIEHKERRIARVLSLQACMAPGTRLASPDALHHMLERVTESEWALMGCFASSTPLPLVHKLLAKQSQKELNNGHESDAFDTEKFFLTTSAPLEVMLTIVKALAAAGCARA